MYSVGSTTRAGLSESNSETPMATAMRDWRWLPLRCAERLNVYPAHRMRGWEAMSPSTRESILRDVYARAAFAFAASSVAILIAMPTGRGAVFVCACVFAAVAAFLYAAMMAYDVDAAEEEEEAEAEAEAEWRKEVGRERRGGGRRWGGGGEEAVDQKDDLPTMDEAIALGMNVRGAEPQREHREVRVIDPERDMMEERAAALIIDYDEEGREEGEDDLSEGAKREMHTHNRLDSVLRADTAMVDRKGRALAPQPTALQRRMVRFGEPAFFNDDASVKALDAPNVPSFLKMRDVMSGDGRGDEDGRLRAAWGNEASRTGIEYFAGEEAADDPFEQQHMFQTADGRDPMFPSLPAGVTSHEEGIAVIHKQTLDKDRLSVWRQSLPSAALTPSSEQACAMKMAMGDERADMASRTEEMMADFVDDSAFTRDDDAKADFDGFLASLGPDETDPAALDNVRLGVASDPTLDDPLFRDA